MEYRVTIITGCAPNLPWWQAMNMTDDEIKTYNDRFLRREVVIIPRNHIGDNMSDIIERLKEISNNDVGDYHGTEAPSIARDAITEIETLRAQLASIRQVAGAVSLESGLTFDAIKGGKYARPVQQPDGSYKMETF